MATIELRRRKAVAVTILFMGVVFVLLGVLFLERAPLAARIFFAVLGALMTVNSVQATA